LAVADFVRSTDSLLTRYAYSVPIVLAACSLNMLFDRLTHVYLPIFFFSAVLFCGWYLGTGPGWFSALASALTFAYYLPPPHSLRVDPHSESFFVPFVGCLALIMTFVHARHYVKRHS